MYEPNIIILAGGISSRMKHSSGTPGDANSSLRKDATQKSKTMLGVGKNARPFLDYLLYNIERSGYRNAVIVVGEHDSSIREYYETNDGVSQFPGLDISYAVQVIPPGRTKPLGTADAVCTALRSRPDWSGLSVTVCNSDNLYSVHALQLLLNDSHSNALIDYDRVALQFARERIAAFAVLKKDERGFLIDILEKPSLAEIESVKDPSGRIGVSMNIFRFSVDAIRPFLEAVPLHPIRREKELPVAVRMMVERFSQSVFTIPLAEHVIDLTSIDDVADVQNYLHNNFPNF